MTQDDIISGILHREGSEYTDHPADKGGPTRHGITRATLAEWRGKPVTADDVKRLTEKEAREIYSEQYIVRPGFLGIENEAVRVFVIDCAVTHGVKEAVLMLQRAAHVFADGILGPHTKQAVNRMTPAALYRRLCADRVRFYGKLITRNPSQATFAHGWANRVAEFIEESP